MIETPLETYQAVFWLAAVGLAVSSLEYWVIAPSFAADGVYSWKVLQLRLNLSARLAGVVEEAAGARGTRLHLAFRLSALAVAALSPAGSGAFTAAVAVLVAHTLLFTYRRGFGDDGSDQMNSILLVTLLLCVRPGASALVLELGLVFIALQACLSYASAGIAKLVSPTWRSGEAIYRIFNTGAYGVPAIARLLRGRRWLNLALCWSVILVESLFPLVLILPGPWPWLFLAWGAAFHLQCAAIMGLNSFFWAFVATYPAILYAGPRLQGLLFG